MNWINRHSRADGSCTVGSCRINRLLFADDMVLLEPLNKASINTHFADACDQVRLKINNKKTDVLCHSRNPRQCTLQVIGSGLHHDEMYLEVAKLMTRRLITDM